MKEKQVLDYLMPKNHAKKGGIVTNTVIGVGLLIIGVIIMYVVVDTLLTAGLLTSGGTLDKSAGNLSTNFSAGVDNIAKKVPTILLIVAVVFLFGALVLLVQQARNMGFGGGASSL